MSSALVLGGFALLATQGGIRWAMFVGLGAVVLGLIVFVASMWAVIRTGRRRREALKIVEQLIAFGDIANRDREGIDQWRSLVGILMTTPPFREGLHNTVLGGHADDWIRQPLATLRDMALHFDDKC